MNYELLDVGTAHQKIIRDKKSIDDMKNDLFGAYWDDISKDVNKSVVKPVSRDLAKKIIEEYEWLGCMAAVNWYYFGIFFDGVCGGVVVYGQEYIENLGRWDKYDFTGNIILLNRGVCLHWTPKNSNSHLIAESIKMLPEKYKIVTATTDHLAGEIGTIYQACNFYYVGSMRDQNKNVNSRAGDRDAWIINGKMYGSRAIRQMYGDTKKETLDNLGVEYRKVKQNSKHRYFFFRGNKKEKKYYKSKIQHLIKPYPKRRTYEKNM